MDWRLPEPTEAHEAPDVQTTPPRNSTRPRRVTFGSETVHSIEVDPALFRRSTSKYWRELRASRDAKPSTTAARDTAMQPSEADLASGSPT